MLIFSLEGVIVFVASWDICQLSLAQRYKKER